MRCFVTVTGGARRKTCSVLESNYFGAGFSVTVSYPASQKEMPQRSCLKAFEADMNYSNLDVT